jgi:hypothetical protein
MLSKQTVPETRTVYSNDPPSNAAFRYEVRSQILNRSTLEHLSGV